MASNRMNDRNQSRRKQKLFNINNSYCFGICSDDDDDDVVGGGVHYFYNDNAAHSRMPSCHTAPSRRAAGSSTDFRRLDEQLLRRAEIERHRRRNVSIMHELLRLCITEDDLREWTLSGTKRLEDLSHYEILRISTRKLGKAVDEMRTIDGLLEEIRQYEDILRRMNIPHRIMRPFGISKTFHQQLGELVENIVEEDARMMSQGGSGMPTPREVALKARRALESLAKKATVMCDVTDTIRVHSSAGGIAPTRAVGSQQRDFNRVQEADHVNDPTVDFDGNGDDDDDDNDTVVNELPGSIADSDDDDDNGDDNEVIDLLSWLNDEFDLDPSMFDLIDDVVFYSTLEIPGA